VREIFLRHHGDLLTPAYWQTHQERIRQGYLYDVFPYGQERRFGVRSPAS